ncbi:hypothetical protein F383_22422 [Gossypium arboreum]|uniref:Uncharacterized protein n=1 Tax=Gossypium arboreum TaxID=29729 RepID=A0A0B0NZZ8_GOSAR|nr:hypothetical protein F383_22422 [Gossypium arboreum]
MVQRALQEINDYMNVYPM